MAAGFDMIGKHRILVGDVLAGLGQLSAGSVHCCIASPPYWGLRDYKAGSQMIGLEPTPEEHIARLVAVFREVRRVLRDDGTAWCNYGDAYATTACGSFNGGSSLLAGRDLTGHGESGGIDKSSGRKSGDLLMLPHRLAFALQADGWWVRSAIVWAKGVSFCDSYSGAVMPESVSGWRWEKCRVKVANRSLAGDPKQMAMGSRNSALNDAKYHPERLGQFIDCPGCEKCEPNGGLVLRKGRWRPTSAYEHVFLLAKSERYYCDAEAVKETATDAEYVERGRVRPHGTKGVGVPGFEIRGGLYVASPRSSRNLRNVWTIGTEPYEGAHFATFPCALVEPIVKVATPERGVCAECGAPWARIVATDAPPPARDNYAGNGSMGVHRCGGDRPGGFYPESRTLGWRATCRCNAPTRPAVVLDPFMGSGTTALVACGLGRDVIGCELNPEYAAMAEERIGKGLRPATYRSQREDDAPLFTGTKS